MLTYIVRRLGIAAITLVLITFIVYGLIRNIPGTPLTIDQSQDDPSKVISQEDLERLKAIYGLDKHWCLAYFDWMRKVVVGNLGDSFKWKRPVSQVLADHIPNTLYLSVSSIFLTYLLSIPLGLYSAAKAGTVWERGISLILYALYSFPGFVAALMLQLFVSVRWGLLPLFGMHSAEYDTMTIGAKVLDLLQHYILPLTVSTYGSLAYYSRFIRSNLQEVIRQDYIRTAKAKGLGPIRVLVHHAFRNTMIPLVTMLGLTLPALLSGSVIIEQIFNWPGMGRLYFESIGTRDYPLVMSLTLIYSVLTLVGQILADVLYALVDPRVRLDTK